MSAAPEEAESCPVCGRGFHQQAPDSRFLPPGEWVCSTACKQQVKRGVLIVRPRGESASVLYDPVSESLEVADNIEEMASCTEEAVCEAVADELRQHRGAWEAEHETAIEPVEVAVVLFDEGEIDACQL